MIRQDYFQYIAQTSPESMGIEVHRAEGVYLYGPNGKRWLDFISGICVSNVGHGAPEILQAIREQSERYLHPMVYGEVIMAPQVRYAQALSAALGTRFEQVYFVNSGAEAMEGALKIAKKYTGRSGIVSCKGAYHGSTHGALSVSGSEDMKRGYGPLLPEVAFIRFNHREDLHRISHKTAAVCLEIIQGAGGVILPEAGYLEAVRRHCDASGALLIIDEIQTGLGRTGSLFAHQAYGLRPDILLLAKSLGGGLPLGAFITRPEVMEVIQRDPPLGFITTFGGNPVCCAAGLALFEKIKREELLAGISEREALLREKLQHPAIKTLRGRGLLYAALFENRATSEAVLQACLQKGLLTIGFLNLDHGLRISPPLNISFPELAEGCNLFLAAITEATAT